MKVKAKYLHVIIFTGLIACLLLLMLACRPSRSGEILLPSSPVPTVAANLPFIHIIAIPEGSLIHRTGDITIAVNVANFDLADKMGQASQPGQGHIHYFLDVDAPTTPFTPAVTSDGNYICTTATSHTWVNLQEGLHKFSVMLVNNDHSPFNPPVVDVRNVILQKPD